MTQDHIDRLVELEEANNSNLDAILAAQVKLRSAMDAFAINYKQVLPLLPKPLAIEFLLNVKRMMELNIEIGELFLSLGENQREDRQIILELLKKIE